MNAEEAPRSSRCSGPPTHAPERGCAAPGPRATRSTPTASPTSSARHRYAVLATARPDGRPHAAPVGYLLADGAIWIATVAGVRLRNLHAWPWASVVVMEGGRDDGEPHRAFTAEGPVVVHEREAFEAALASLRERWVARHGSEPGWARALVELRPERVFSYAAG